MAKKNNKTTKDPEINLGEAISKTENFFNKYKKTIIYSVIGIVAVFVIGLLYNQFVIVPKQNEAVNQTFRAEQYFKADDYEKALNGDGNALGFAQIVAEYGNKAGAAVYLYAGICELQLGNYQSAINYLKKYNGKDQIMAARSMACIGDAYVNLGELEAAVVEYEKAAAYSDNILAAGYLMKAALVYEELGKNEKALEKYETVKAKYPQSYESMEVDKYITRIKSK